MNRQTGAVAVRAGAMTMVALAFANGLQGGMSTTWGQAVDSIKHTFHVKDAALGIVPAAVTITGNVGGVPIAAFCLRHKRTLVLSVMFLIWGALIALAGLTPAIGFASIGFVIFAIFRVSAATLEATDPAALPLISDWWPVEERAKRVSIFNTVAGVGGFGGLALSGVLVDQFGWRPAFLIWVPLAVLGAVLIRRQTEPEPGVQDRAYRSRLEEITRGEEHELVVELTHDGHEEAPDITGFWNTARAVFAQRTWRLAAIGLSVGGIMGSGLMAWGIPYFKRTFHLSGTEATGLAPVLGAGAFFGVLLGGYIADWLLARGLVRARLWVTVGGYGGGAVFYALAFASTSLAVAAPFLAIGSTLGTIPLGPQSAIMMDTTPPRLRSQASAALNVLQASGFIGPLLVGILSTAFGENLRLALLCVSPVSLVGAFIVFAARHTYVEDVALVVAEASGAAHSPPPAHLDGERPRKVRPLTAHPLRLLAVIAAAGALLDAAIVVFAVHLVRSLHVSASGLVGLVVGASAVRLVSGAAVAPLARRVGLWRMVAAGAVVAALVTPLLAVVTSVGGALFVIAVVGIAGAPVATAHLALLAATTGPRRARTFAVHAGSAIAARGVGAGLLAGLASIIGWRPVLLVPLVGIVPAVIAARQPELDVVPDPWSHAAARLSRLRSRPPLTAALAIAGFAVLGLPAIVRSFLLAHHLPTTRQGSLDVVALGIALAGLPVAARLGDVWSDAAGRARAVSGGLAVFGAGMLLTALTGGWASTAIALGVALAGLVVAIVTTGVLLVEVVPPATRLASLGLGGLLAAFWGLTGVVLASAARSAWGPGAVLALLGVVAVAAAGLVGIQGDALDADIAGATKGVSVSSSGALDISEVVFSYGRQQVLFDVSLRVEVGEVVALLGTNGAGKSTLLRLAAGLDHPHGGIIRLFGQDTTYTEAEQIRAMGVSLLAGGRMTFPSLTVAENIRVAAQTRWRRGVEDEVYEAFPTLAERRTMRAGTLSGGEQQMLALGRCLISQPRLLLLDELTLGLAPIVVQQLLATVRGLNAAGTTVVVVEQSANLALSLASRALFLERGTVMFDGPAAELLTHDELLRPVFLG